MSNQYDFDEPFDVEAMVRAAGQYVRASDDLRPRVLEAARVNCTEQRAQRCVKQVSLFLVLLTFFTAADRHAVNDQMVRPSGILAAARFDEMVSSTVAATPRSGDGDWRMVDAFTELRRQQAALLRLSL